jgi:hypothetical protein
MRLERPEIGRIERRQDQADLGASRLILPGLVALAL